jgi:hypothetical protein
VRLAGWILAAGCLLGGAARVAIGIWDQGIYWPDEIYQSLEPAHRLVHGYGLVAWEFIEGARNWALPGLVAAVLWLAQLLGGDSPAAYLLWVRVVFALVALGTAWGIARLAATLGAAPLAAAAGATVFALAGPIVYFGHRALSGTASALPLVWGLALALDARKQRWRLWLGASLIGVAVLLRLQNGIFAVGVLAVLAGRRDWRALGEGFGVLCVWALLFGLLDRLTWGSWFHSALVYLRFNLIEGKASAWGTSPWTYYLRVLWGAMPGLSAALLVGVALSVRRAPGVFLVALAFVVLHSWIPHKELRFLLPVMPLVCALAAVGISSAAERWDARVLAGGSALLVMLSLASLGGAKSLNFGDLGAYPGAKAGQSAWRDFDDVNRLLLAAHDEPELCGLKMEVVHQAWTGGFTYLHRRVPYYSHDGAPRSSGHFNYVITWADRAPGRVAAQVGRVALVQLSPGCTPDPAYSWRLP